MDSQLNYFIMQPVLENGMLLSPVARPPNRQSWTIGKKFDPLPTLPIVSNIRNGYETAVPGAFYGVPSILSDALYSVLLAAGVDNLDVYDAVLRSEDGLVELKNYKAFNLIGLVKAADLKTSMFSAKNPSRSLDASFDKLVIDEEKIEGRLMFRLAEYTSAVVVHRSVRAAIESAGFPSVGFVNPADFMS